MPRRAKGPRLWLQPARRDARGVVIEQAVWCVRDGNRKLSTGIGDVEVGRTPQAAEDALRNYLNAKKTPRVRDRDPSQVEIATVIAIYAEDIAPRSSRPKETAFRLGRVLEHFKGRTLDYLNKTTCAEYVKWRGFEQAARRDLEDLRAAVRHHWELGLCTALTPVVLPDKSDPREDWMTRKQAAHLLWTAWRKVQVYKGGRTARRTGKHIAHFILAGLYTGTRAGAICGAALAPEPGKGWIDAENGIFYRRAFGRKRTKKRQPSIRMPPRLLAHTRRWIRKRLIRRAWIEWNGEQVLRVSKGFAEVAEAADLPWVTPHTLRHTAITWQAQLGVPAHEICGYFGITMEMFERVYAHHHPDYQSNAVNAFNRRKPVKVESNVMKLTG